MRRVPSTHGLSSLSLNITTLYDNSPRQLTQLVGWVMQFLSAPKLIRVYSIDERQCEISLGINPDISFPNPKGIGAKKMVPQSNLSDGNYDQHRGSELRSPECGSRRDADSAYCPTRSCRLEVNNSYAAANVRLLLGIIAFITYWLHPKLEQTIPRFRHEALGFKALSKQVVCLPCIGTLDQVIRMVMLGIRIVYNGLVAQANASA